MRRCTAPDSRFACNAFPPRRPRHPPVGGSLRTTLAAAASRAESRTRRTSRRRHICARVRQCTHPSSGTSIRDHACTRSRTRGGVRLSKTAYSRASDTGSLLTAVSQPAAQREGRNLRFNLIHRIIHLVPIRRRVMTVCDDTTTTKISGLISSIWVADSETFFMMC
jgi:hypothetical protein